MANKGLSKWIKTQKEKGYSVQQIKQSLLKQGYKEEDINKIFSKKRTIIVIGLIILIIIILTLFIFSFQAHFPEIPT